MITLETAAVALAIAYLLLAMRQNIWCWAAAMGSTTIYLYVFYEARLYMESALQIFYFAMAVYGWHQWRHGGEGGQVLRVSTWNPRRHLYAIGLVLALALASGSLLARYTEAALPFADSVTTWGGVVATYMVARKILENWIYWFVIDSISIGLYLDRGLHQTAALFALYLVLIVFGYLAWRKDLQRAPAPGAA